MLLFLTFLKKIWMQENIMGSILMAQCKCGFKLKSLFVGGGMANFDKICKEPAICLKCNILLIKNNMKKHSFFHPRCPKCWRKITFYSDPKVQKQEFKSYERYNLNGEKKTFRLPDTHYYCPECNEMTLKFVDIGNWD
jgi:hypothetical protein